MVDGILVSSYANVHPYSLLVGQHWAAHTFFAFRRIACAFDFDICRHESYTNDGFPEWLAPVIRWAISTTGQHPTVQVVASFVGLPIIGAVFLFERALLYYPFFVASFFAMGLMLFRNSKASKVKSH